MNQNWVNVLIELKFNNTGAHNDIFLPQGMFFLAISIQKSLRIKFVFIPLLTRLLELNGEALFFLNEFFLRKWWGFDIEDSRRAERSDSELITLEYFDITDYFDSSPSPVSGYFVHILEFRPELLAIGIGTMQIIPIHETRFRVHMVNN